MRLKRPAEFCYPKAYRDDWRKLARTNHVKYDRERSNRMLELKNDDYVILALKVVDAPKWYLIMNSGAVIVAGNGATITVLTKKMKLSKSIKILWEMTPNEEV